MELGFQMMFGYTGAEIPGFDMRKLDRIASERGQYHYMAKEFKVSEEEWEIVKSWYDEAILYLDYSIGELTHFLQREGISENTLLVLTSDHGENFGEHGLASHQFCLYDSLIHVPLILVYPDVIPQGRRISSLVSHTDIFPTILDLLNIECDVQGIQGKSLVPFGERTVHDFICAECGESVRSRLEPGLRSKLEPYDKGSKCLRTEEYKYIISADQKEELYDIKENPSEKVNIAEKHPDKTTSFREQLQDTVDTSFFGPKEFPHKEERSEILKRLQSLGYI